MASRKSHVLTKKEPTLKEGFDRRLDSCFTCGLPRFTKEGKPKWKSEHTLFFNSPYAIKITICRECRQTVTIEQLFDTVYETVGTTKLTEEPF